MSKGDAFRGNRNGKKILSVWSMPLLVILNYELIRCRTELGLEQNVLLLPTFHKRRRCWSSPGSKKALPHSRCDRWLISTLLQEDMHSTPLKTHTCIYMLSPKCLHRAEDPKHTLFLEKKEIHLDFYSADCCHSPTFWSWFNRVWNRCNPIKPTKQPIDMWGI